jgi:hypothetical protein
MRRFLAPLLFCAFATVATAQNHDFIPEDTDAMRVSASKHMTLVDDAVALSAEQKVKVQEAYMQQERQLVAVNHRFDMSGYTAEERASEMAAQWSAMEKLTSMQLKEALTGTQWAKWEELSK